MKRERSLSYRKKMQKEEASVRFPDFQIFATLFSPLLSLRPHESVLVVFSLPLYTASPISHPIVFLARAAGLGFTNARGREREREKE